MGGVARLRLLLDTHIILWSAAEPEKLSRNITNELESDSNELWFSPISVWEILLLAEKDRISLGPDIVKSVREIFRALPSKEATINR
jgi:PIN domain nuclease of toxin-antitoxin system